MKSSLRKSIGLFNIPEQVKLYVALLFLKAGKKLPAKLELLFANCKEFVNLIERGVVLSKAHSGFIKASLTMNEQQVTVYLRHHSSDQHVLTSVLLAGEYRVAIEYLKKISENRPLHIIDAGGNVGFTSIYFHCFFPESEIVAIEPDKDNVSVFQKNLSACNIQGVQVLQNALWTRNERLVIEDSFRDGKEWSLTVDPVGAGREVGDRQLLEGITLQQVFAKAGWEKVDLLKIDIEGAERFLFKDALFLEQLQNVSAVVIEIHDEFQIRETIYEEMQKLRFRAIEVGDVTFFTRA